MKKKMNDKMKILILFGIKKELVHFPKEQGTQRIPCQTVLLVKNIICT